jgi:diacylglycerol kinase family enzyme
VKRRRLFPRSHPNDGRFEILEIAAEMSARQRFAALRRIRTDSHLPHPLLTTRNTNSFHAVWPSPMRIVVDGHKLGSAREITVEIRPDAGITYVAA